MKCPATAWSGSAPYPLPDYVPQDSVQPDIHPGADCAREGRARGGV